MSGINDPIRQNTIDLPNVILKRWCIYNIDVMINSVYGSPYYMKSFRIRINKTQFGQDLLIVA